MKAGGHKKALKKQQSHGGGSQPIDLNGSIIYSNRLCDHIDTVLTDLLSRCYGALVLIPILQKFQDGDSVPAGTRLYSAIAEMAPHLQQLHEFYSNNNSNNVEDENNKTDEENPLEAEDKKPNKETVKFHIKCVLRAVNENSSTIQFFKKESMALFSQMSDDAKEFMSLLEALVNHMKERLLLNAQLKSIQKRQFVQYQKQWKDNVIIVDKLDSQLLYLRLHKDKNIHEKNEINISLLKSIHNIEVENQYIIDNVKMKQQVKCDHVNSRSQERISELQSRKRNVIELLKDVQDKNNQSVEQLRRTKWKLENEVETRIGKYDKDMRSIQKTYEEEVEENNKSVKTIEEVERVVKSIEVKYNKIIEERRIKEEKRLAAEHEKELLFQSALIIQSFWRAFKARRTLRAQKAAEKKERKY